MSLRRMLFIFDYNSNVLVLRRAAFILPFLKINLQIIRHN